MSRPVSGILYLVRRGELGDDHPSHAAYPRVVGRSRRTSSSCSLLGLAPSGVYRAVQVALHAGALLPHRCTLTCDRRSMTGGPSAVSLCCTSVRSPQPGSRQHSALWSPDFPRHDRPSFERRRAAVTRPTHHRGSVYGLVPAPESGAVVRRRTRRDRRTS